MRRALVICAVSVLLVLSIPAAALYWLCCTEPGLLWIAGQTSRLKSVQLRIEGLHGSLNKPITAERIEVVQDRLRLVASGVRMRIGLHGLLLQTLRLSALEADSVEAALKRSAQPPSGRKLRFIPVPWLTVRVDGIQVGSSLLTLQNGRQLLARKVAASSRMSADRIELRDWQVDSLELVDTQPSRPASTAAEAAPKDSKTDEEEDRAADRHPDTSQPGAPPRIALAGTTELRAADPIGLSGDVRWSIALAQQPVYSGRTRFEGDITQLKLDGTVLQPLQASATGRLLDLTSRWRWEAQISAPAFSLKPWAPESALGNFALSFDGKGDSTNIHLAGRVVPDSVPVGPVTVAIDGSYAGRTLQAERLQLGLSNGTEVVTHGTIRFAGGPPQLDLAGTWSRLAWPLRDPVVRSARGQLTLTGDLPYLYTARGDVSGAKIPALQLDVRGAVGRNRLVVRELQASVAEHGSLTAAGAFAWAKEKSWRLAVDARDLDPALLDTRYPGKLSFRLEGNGAIGRSGGPAAGPWTLELIGLRGQLRKKPVSGGAVVKRSAQLWEIESAKLQFGSAHLEAGGRFDERPAHQPDIRWLFSATDLADVVPEAGGEVHFSGRLAGTHDAPQLSSSLNAKNLRYGHYRAAALQGQADIDLTSALSTALSAEDAGRAQLQLEATDAGLAGQTFQTIAIDLGGNTAKHALRAEAAARDRKIELEVHGAYTPRQWQGRLEKLSFTALQTRLALDRPAGLFVGEDRLEIEPFCLRYDPQRICGEAKAVGARTQPWKEFDLTGSLQAQTRELDFIPALVPEIDRAAGDLDVRLRMSGKLGAPQIEGTLALEKGELDLYAVNLLMRQVSMRLEMAGKTLSLTGSAQAGEGHLAVDGRLAWESGAPNGNLDIKGENLLIVNVPEARVQASPAISVGINGREIQVDGAVRVPYARLSPANLSGAMLPTEDEIIVGTPPSDPNKSFRITTGIHLILGKDVRVDSYGLSGRITGGIAAYTGPDEASTAAGELQIEEGKYVAYGRELNIDRGRLIFTGGVLSNPGVDLRASKKIDETTTVAGINVRGTLRDPRLTFFSEPPLPQTQAAALLITGRTFDSLQQGGGPGLGREQLLAQGGALLAKQLGGQLGIDAVSVESGANNDTSLVLGKYLSPRLYVGYGISLAESINTLKLRYTLGDHWTIKMEAGEARSTDVVYAIDR